MGRPKSGGEAWPGTLDRSINGYRKIVGENLTNCRGVTCDGLASRPGGVEILLAASCYGNRDKLRPDEPVGPIRLHFTSLYTIKAALQENLSVHAALKNTLVNYIQYYCKPNKL